MLTMTSGWLEPAGDLSLALLTMVSPCAVSTESSRWFKGLSRLLQNSLLRFLSLLTMVVAKCCLFSPLCILIIEWTRPCSSGDRGHWWVSFRSPSLKSNQVCTQSGFDIFFEILCRESKHFYLKFFAERVNTFIWNSLQGERTLLRNRGEFSLHLPT